MLARVRDGDARIMELFWNRAVKVEGARARICVMALNRPGVLGHVSTTIGKMGVNIADLRFGRKTRELYEIFMDVEVSDVEHLHQLLAALRSSPHVTHVERPGG